MRAHLWIDIRCPYVEVQTVFFALNLFGVWVDLKAGRTEFGRVSLDLAFIGGVVERYGR